MSGVSGVDNNRQCGRIVVKAVRWKNPLTTHRVASHLLVAGQSNQHNTVILTHTTSNYTLLFSNIVRITFWEVQKVHCSCANLHLLPINSSAFNTKHQIHKAEKTKLAKGRIKKSLLIKGKKIQSNKKKFREIWKKF